MGEAKACAHLPAFFVGYQWWLKLPGNESRGYFSKCLIYIFFLEICRFLSLGQKNPSQQMGLVGWGSVSRMHLPGCQALGWVCREKTSIWGTEEPCRA